MPRQLWLLRHADAEPHGTREDSARRLTERGERQARLAGEAIALMGVEFEVLLSSPKERALRTATVAAQAWSERSELGQSELGASGIGQSGIEPSGIEPSGIVPSGIEQSGIEQSGIEQSGIGQSGIVPSGIVPSGTGPSAPGAHSPPGRDSASSSRSMRRWPKASTHGRPWQC